MMCILRPENDGPASKNTERDILFLKDYRAKPWDIFPPDLKGNNLCVIFCANARPIKLALIVNIAVTI